MITAASSTLRQWPAGAAGAGAAGGAGAPPPPPPGQRAAGQEDSDRLPWNFPIALDLWVVYIHPKTNREPLKMDAWKAKCPIFKAIVAGFRGKVA